MAAEERGRYTLLDQGLDLGMGSWDDARLAAIAADERAHFRTRAMCAAVLADRDAARHGERAVVDAVVARARYGDALGTITRLAQVYDGGPTLADLDRRGDGASPGAGGVTQGGADGGGPADDGVPSREPTPREEALASLDDARRAYERFVESWEEVGRYLRRTDTWLAHRVEAYPGWHGSRDQGAGQSMTEWMDEVRRALEDEGESLD